MCGIAGVVGPNRNGKHADPFEALAHRGPDARGHRALAGEGWAWELFHTRLSIVDLSSAGEQPISNEDGSLLMIFNGEIYNSDELRSHCLAGGHTFRSSMDGEVILHLWETEGIQSLNRLNGIFALAIGNTGTGEVVLARDPLGVKPLFYSTDKENRLWFASELTALRAAGAPVGSPDLVGLAQFLSFLWIPDPRTPYAGAHSLRPGHVLTWTPTSVRHERYSPPFKPTYGTDYPTAEVALRDAGERFQGAARRQLMADVPVGLMASGGVDSGLIWSATKEVIVKAYTISWDTDGGDERLSEDVLAVRALQRKFQTRVDYLPGSSASKGTLPPSGDLFADPAYQLTKLIAKAAHEQGIKVLLSGQGGDELFGGYRRHSAAPWVGRVRLGGVGRAAESLARGLGSQRLRTEYAARVLRAMSEPDPFDGYMQFCTYSSPSERARALGCFESEVSNDIMWQEHRHVFDSLPVDASFLRKVMAVDLRVYLPGLGLAYVDRAGMEYGVEIRVPWLDLDFVRWSLSLPDHLLIRRGRGKWLTRELASRELGPKVAQRPKRGFAAPTSTVHVGETARGDKGFRQGEYFARATSILKEFLEADGART